MDVKGLEWVQVIVSPINLSSNSQRHFTNFQVPLPKCIYRRLAKTLDSFVSEAALKLFCFGATSSWINNDWRWSDWLIASEKHAEHFVIPQLKL